MKLPRFSLITILLATAIVAIQIGSLVTMCRAARAPEWAARDFIVGLVIIAPIWLPFTFISFAIGRRQLTATIVLLLALAEAVAIPVAVWAMHKWL